MAKINPVGGNGGFAKRVANWINNSEGAQKVLRGINKNPAIFSAVAAFTLASIMRPITIGLLPFKNKKDKRVSQASAISAGLVELGTTAAIFLPLNKAIESSSKRLYKAQGTFYEGNNVALRQFKSVTNRGFKLLFLPLISLARFALVRPVSDFLFGKNKGEEALKKEQERYQRDVKRYLEAQLALAEAGQEHKTLAQMAEGGRLNTWA